MFHLINGSSSAAAPGYKYRCLPAVSVWNPLWASELVWESGDISHMMLPLLRRGCVDIRMCRYVVCRYVVCRYVDMGCCCSSRHRLPQAAHLWTAFSTLGSVSVFGRSTERSYRRGEEGALHLLLSTVTFECHGNFLLNPP